MAIVICFVFTGCETFKRVIIKAGEVALNRYKKVRMDEGGSEWIKRKGDKYIKSNIKTDAGLIVYELASEEVEEVIVK